MLRDLINLTNPSCLSERNVLQPPAILVPYGAIYFLRGAAQVLVSSSYNDLDPVLIPYIEWRAKTESGPSAPGPLPAISKETIRTGVRNACYGWKADILRIRYVSLR